MQRKNSKEVAMDNSLSKVEAAAGNEELSHSDGGDSFSHESVKDILEGSSTNSKLTPNQQMQALALSRCVVASILILVMVAAGVTTYFMGARTQDEYLKIQFDDASSELLDSAHKILENAVAVFATMGTTMSGLASNVNWPFYTQENFEAFGQSFLKGSAAELVSWSPIIRGEANRIIWGNYSGTNNGWVEEGLQWQSNHLGLPMPSGPFDVPAEIYFKRASGDNNEVVVPATGSGPFAPIWQMAGAPSDPSVVNFNLLSNVDFVEAFNAATQDQKATLTKPLDATRFFGEGASPETASVPQTLLVTPISNNIVFDDSVGVLVSVLSWDTFFQNVLLPGTPKVFVVMEDNACGDTFTLSVAGRQVNFLGMGNNFHDKEHEDLRIESDFATEQTSYMDCQYIIKVYPSQEFVDNYINKEPGLWTLFVVGILLLVSVVFFVYDLFVQKRQFRYNTLAAKSNAIVSSLFPAEVRDRLFGQEAPSAAPKKEDDIFADSARYKLRRYIDPSSRKEVKDLVSDADSTENDHVEAMSESCREEAVPNADIGVDMYQTKPIADLFPNTTIMFADIAGFTAWASVREPSQVFTLLETVYSAFDAVAKRRRVFKVETVGDCYVAVAGLPEARPDHAIVMAKFAKECLDRFNELAKQLEIKLGPDTADLAMRAGLHSGPVTAGVLRGDKSRFQLFGDTVNVAARVESTGKRNRVHLSSDTADLLLQAGKEHWIRKRPDLVLGKGKGSMQTYWLHSPGQDTADETNASPIDAKAIHKNVPLDELEDVLPPKVKRLVGWNVEILKKILQQIVAKREAAGKKRSYDAQIKKMEETYGKKQYLLDEIKEIIHLPKFDGRDHDTKKEEGKVELPEDVVNQLRLYVNAVAALHRDNPFHNFEHASHVTMSVSKLLARIVAPDQIASEQGASLASSLHDHTYGITSDPLTQFGCVLAALIHDTDHAGVSNAQLVKEKALIASVFKEKSVAEQNSVVLAWERLMDPRFEALRRCIYSEPSELERFRALVVNNVLATDIFDKELQALRRGRWEKAFQQGGIADANVHDDINRKATVVMEHLIQASDVAHTMQHWHIYQKWNERLFAEMTLAFQAGRQGFDPAANWYQGELGFFDNYIIPLANKLKECGIFGVSSDEYLNYALENRREWANKGEEVVKRYITTYCERKADDSEEGDAKDDEKK